MFKNIPHKALDDLNWSILKELSENSRISTTEIGRRVGLSAPAVAERIQKLEEQGFVKGYHAIIDFDKIGLTIQAFINFKATSIKHDQMLKIINGLPEVLEWYTITGNSCLLLKVAVDSSLELERIIAHLGQFGETSTSMILSGSSGSGMRRRMEAK